MKHLLSRVVVVLAVALTLACGGILPLREPEPTRLEMARRVAQEPLPTNVPAFLTPYQPRLGNADSQGNNLRVRRVHHIWIRLDPPATYGPIAFNEVRLGFGPLDHRDDRLLREPLNQNHVLLDLFTQIAPEQCTFLRPWLAETYGPEKRFRKGWDGVTHAIKIMDGVGGAPGQPKPCAIWWSYWPPIDRHFYHFFDGEPLPRGSGHQVAEPYRLTYSRAWFATAQRVLRGESLDDVEPAILDADLDEASRQELRKHLAALIDEPAP